MEELNITFDNININPIETEIDTPMIVQTDGLSADDALTFVKDCADGKRKIAKAVRSKYETITNKESGITEYSTFEEMSAKIADIPITVPMGSAMEQNGGVLPFYDVYNEALKAWDTFGGRGYKGCCAFELDKGDYDNDHKISLSGASAYYTSDKGELITTDTEYQFKDTDQPNTNRFVVYFFDIEEGDKYQVPIDLHATSVLNLWCIKGTPLISFNGNYTALNSINVYSGDNTINSVADLIISNITALQKINLYHIKQLNAKCIYTLSNLKNLSLPNLESIGGNIPADIFIGLTNLRGIYFNKLKIITTGGTGVFAGFGDTARFPALEEIKGTVRLFASCNDLKKIYAPNLTYIKTSSNLIQGCSSLELISFDSLEIVESATQMMYISKAKHIYMPKLKITNSVIIGGSSSFDLLTLGKAVGGNIKVSNTSTTNECVITVEDGFKSTLNMGYLKGLTTESVHAIIDNLAICEGEDKDKYTITLSSSVATTEIENAIVAKGYKFAKLG